MPQSTHLPDELLTPRQLEVLELIAKGLTNSEIANVLGIAAGTAKNHVAAVLEALEVSNRTEAVGLLSELAHAETPGDAAHAVPGFGARPTLALLPLDNLGPPEDGYIADGLVEDLTTALAAWRWFPVIARNSAFAYRDRSDRGIDVRQVSQELGARYVLEGSARRFRDRLRVHVQLIDGASGEHLWAERYDRVFDDLFAVQDEIVEHIVAALEPTLATIERMRALRRPMEDLDAWDSLQRGLHVLWRQQLEDPLEAEQWLRKAIEAAPDASAGWAALAQCQTMWATWGRCEDPGRWLADAEESARRAIELDPMDYAGYLGLGASLGFRAQLLESTSAFEQATSLNPSCAQGWFGLAVNALVPGDQEKTVAYCEQAIRLSPRDPMLHHFEGVRASALLWLDDHPAALTAAEASLAAEPSRAFSYRPLLAACYGYLDRFEEAGRLRDEILDLDPEFSLGPSRLFASPELVDRVAEGLRRFGWEPK